MSAEPPSTPSRVGQAYARLRHAIKPWNATLQRLPFTAPLARFLDTRLETDPVWVDTQHGFRLLVDPRDHTLGREVVATRTWQPGLLRVCSTLVRPGDTAVDVGANVGYVVGVLAGLVGPRGRVLAFEPEPRTRAMLLETVAANGWQHVEVIDRALGDAPGTAELSLDRGNWGNSSLAAGLAFEPGGTVRVPVSTLDAELDARGVDRVALLKVDVQGWEGHLYAGAVHSVRRVAHHVVEFDPTALRAAGTDPAELLSRWQALGTVWLLDEETGEASAVDAARADALVQAPPQTLIDLMIVTTGPAAR